MYCGIDPGLTGGIVVLNSNADVIYKTVMPVTNSDKKEYDIKTLIEVFNNIRVLDKDIRVCLEKSYVRPIQGIRAAFSTGYGFGILQALLESNQMSYEIINPTVWMKEVFMGNYRKDEKKQSVLWAQRKWPKENWLPTIKSKMASDGLTDSAGMAFYMYLRYKGSEI
jgi:hypothetical protein